MGSFTKRFLVIVLLFAALTGSWACGPVESTTKSYRIESLLRQARELDAHKYAPYEYFTAKYYHLKGKEDVGYSEYEQAIRYFNHAVKMANQAMEKARLHSKKR